MNPAVASVDATGKVTAVGVGATTLTVSSGDAQDIATVSVGQVAPAAVIVPAAGILSTNGSQVTLLSATVPGLKIDCLIVRGDQGGLLGSVTAIQNRGPSLVVTYSPISLAQAFPNANVHLRSSPRAAVLTLSRGRAALQYPNGTRTTLAANALSCTTTGTAQAVETVSLSLNEQVTVITELDYQTTNAAVVAFSLSATINGSLSAAIDSLSVEGNASGEFTCTTTQNPVTLKSVWRSE
jgi:hypothetical protein